MKKMILGLFFVLTIGLTINLFAMAIGTTKCVSRPATRENAGRILDWCDDVTCWECWEYSASGVIIHTKGCEANC